MRKTIVLAVCVAIVEFSGASAQTPGFALSNFFVEEPLDITTGDFNNDGFLDIAISDNFIGPSGTHRQQILLNDGTGNFSLVWSLFANSAAHNALVAGFFDANDTLDIVKPIGSNFPGRGSLLPLRGLGDGTFQFTTHFYDTDTDWPNWITAADFNRDGFLDVAIAATEIDYPSLPGRDLVSVLLGDGALGFSSPDTFFIGLRPREIISDDFNGDNNPDLAVALSGEDSIAVILGLGDGTFQLPPFKCAVADSPVALVSGYLDAGLSRDIAVVNNKSESVSILLGLGNGQFSVVPSTFSVGTNPVSITEGVFGGDGAHDLAVANRGSDDVTLLIGSSDGYFSTTYTYGVAPGPRGITCGDFNGDYLLDLAVSCQDPVPVNPDSVSVLIHLVSTGIDDGPPPVAYRLGVNYPNPFNPATVIEYSIAEDSRVYLSIYNVSGQLVRTLVDDFKKASNYKVTWDGKNSNGESVSSGVYFYGLRANKFVASKKLVILR